MTDIFRPFAVDLEAYDRLIGWLLSKGYHYHPRMNRSDVNNFEATEISFMKNINGQNTMIGSMYEHDHIGIFITFNALTRGQTFFMLSAQDVRETLSQLDSLKPEMQKFLIEYHARCDGCGYCTQRNRARTSNPRPYTINVDYSGTQYSLCPINYVYTYCWCTLNEVLVDGIIGYLELMERKYGI